MKGTNLVKLRTFVLLLVTLHVSYCIMIAVKYFFFNVYKKHRSYPTCGGPKIAVCLSE